MKAYSSHIFVCQGKRCLKKGGEGLIDELKSKVKKLGYKQRVRVSRSGCLKTCKESDKEGEYCPVIVVYPQGVWYKNVTPEDLGDIVEASLKGDIVERIHYFTNTGISS